NAYERYIHRKGKDNDTSQYWVFQANPKYYDLAGAVSALKEITYEINQHEKEIRKGDHVYLWEAGPNAGIVAAGAVISNPAEMRFRDDEKRFTRDESQFKELHTRVLVRLDNVLKQ